MTTEQTAQQLELAAQILRTGHPFEVRHDALNKWHASLGVNPAQAVLQDWHLRPVLATPPDNRPLHNPDNLTAEQIGVGWRLLLASEMQGGLSSSHPGHHNCEGWEVGKWNDEYSNGSDFSITYRLPLSVPWPEPADPYAELKKAHAEGRVIQSFNRERSIWQDCPSPAFEGGTEYRVKPETPAFQLPPPPPGMQWHRTDGWQERDLPQGMRPLVVNEESQPDDEHWTSDRGPWKALNRGGIIYDEGHTRCRTRRPLTFTHAGKTWTWHRPGDPRPCDGERKVVLLRTIRELSANDKYATLSKNWTWDDPLIIGWRYADEPKPKVPLGPEDIFPGCAIRAEKSEAWFTPTRVSVEGIHHANIGSGVQFTYFTSLHQARYEINRSLPTTGKWNPNAWEPCHKIISENG